MLLAVALILNGDIVLTGGLADGIEIIQKIAGRELPLKVQTIVSYVGIALFALLFVYMLRSDVLRFIL